MLGNNSFFYLLPFNSDNDTSSAEVSNTDINISESIYDSFSEPDSEISGHSSYESSVSEEETQGRLVRPFIYDLVDIDYYENVDRVPREPLIDIYHTGYSDSDSESESDESITTYEESLSSFDSSISSDSYDLFEDRLVVANVPLCCEQFDTLMCYHGISTVGLYSSYCIWLEESTTNFTAFAGALHFLEEVYESASGLQLQSLELQSDNNNSSRSSLDYIRALLSDTENVDYSVKLAEDVFVLGRSLYASKSKTDLFFSVLNFLKLRTNGSLILTLGSCIKNYYDELTKDELEFQAFEGFLEKTKDGAEDFKALMDSPLWNKLYKFIMYSINLSLFTGIFTTDKLKDMGVWKVIEKSALKKKFFLGTDFLKTIVDTIVYLCEMGYQTYITGSLEPLYHCGSSYGKWFKLSEKVISDSKYLSNPELGGFTEAEFIMNLQDTIEKGNSIKKFAKSSEDQKLIAPLLEKLRIIEANYLTKNEAKKTREAPFALTIFSGSGVGKSTFMKILFHYYAKIFDMPSTDNYCYTRNFDANFWDGFSPSQWAIIMDDVAILKPNYCPTGDLTLNDLIRVVNNVGYSPDQADIDLKGRTPMRAKLVLATTNCESMNIGTYFQTPLAVQRRFPFTIDLKVKPEVAHPGTDMLDSSLASAQEGYWPDWWIIKVSKVVPVVDAHKRDVRQGQQGRLELVFETDDIEIFLQWYMREIKDHVENQKKVLSSHKEMQEIKICKQCGLIDAHCPCIASCSKCTMPIGTCSCLEMQADNSMNVGGLITSMGVFWTTYWFSIFEMYVFSYQVRLLYYSVVVLFSTLGVPWLMDKYYSTSSVNQIMLDVAFKIMGDRINREMNKHKKIINILKCSLQLYTVFKIVQSIYKTFKPMMNDVKTMTPQTEDMGVTPVANDEEENVWYKDDFIMTSCDVTAKTLSWKGLSYKQVSEQIDKNLIHMSIKFEDNGVWKYRKFRSVCLVGQTYMCNNHGLPDNALITVDIKCQGEIGGVNANISVILSQQEIFRFPDRDIALFKIINLPPRKSIIPLFAKATMRGCFDGHYLGRNALGYREDRFVKNIFYRPKVTYVKHDINLDCIMWEGAVEDPTLMGDCGSLLLCITSYGPAILGFHTLGGNQRVIATSVTQEFIANSLKQLDQVVIECGDFQLNAETTHHELAPLHKKSTFRYMEKGTAEVYGSIRGYRIPRKSRVTRSVIYESMVKRGYECLAGPPNMTYLPWRFAALEYVNPVVNLDTSILDKCVDAYYMDILLNLPNEAWDEIMIYDNMTAINGAVGVKFVDKIKRQTSAGFPFNTTKMKFLLPIEPDIYPDGVDITDEIKLQVENMILSYKLGECCRPIFTATIKDEPVSVKKQKKGNSRIFACSPFYFTIVMRKFFLSMTRVIQLNPFCFEAMPGTNAHSIQWQNIYSYITKFGTDRMVAGDYAAFDKSMPPCVVLAAFKILIKCITNKIDDPQVEKILWCIAYDVAYPTLYFNGDLVRIFCSNPSGHSLTVIINCLAGALYVRYAYYVANPKKEVSSFRDNVALVTYGDDNVMGINKEINWFNHTVIQNVLSDVGITYTMADKISESVPFIDISEVTFLKRSFTYSKDVDGIVAPLAESSIIKSLMVGVSSASITEEARIIEVMSSANREWFFYGREKFEKQQALMKEIVAEYKLESLVTEHTFLSYERILGEIHLKY